jgi:Taurine catabolism dioxygenase TauD, TfdA family
MADIQEIRSTAYPRILVDEAALDKLRQSVRTFDFSHPRGYLSTKLTRDLADCVATGFEKLDVRRIQTQMATRDDRQPGFCVFRFGSKICDWPEEDLSNVLLCFCSIFGIPLRVFDRWPMWKPLGVSFEVGPQRATGVGLNPLHIDVVNSRFPPDYVAFFCDRVDPLGGGQTLIGNLLSAYKSLSTEALKILSDPHFVEGAFYDLTGVGSEYNPFPIIDMNSTPPRIRFTAKMRYDLSNADDRNAFDEFATLLRSRQSIFLLEAGDLIVINQWVAAHGRLPLGEGQRDLSLENRRLIRQCFMSEEIR